jgi:hypothetical protein
MTSEIVDLVHVAEDKDQWQVVVMNFGFQKGQGIS